MNEPQPPRVGWPVPETPGPEPGVEFAPHGTRLVAYLIDAGILTVVAIALLLSVGLAFLGGASAPGDGSTLLVGPGAVLTMVVLFTLLLFVILMYFPFFWARGGQTPGMWPFGLRVVRDQDGGRIGWGTALLRMLGMYVASAVFYLGFIWIFVDKRRRGFHDLIAGTVVVKRSPPVAIDVNGGMRP
jgi:uncharacterized RDD family membrane protein YckC